MVDESGLSGIPGWDKNSLNLGSRSNRQNNQKLQRREVRITTKSFLQESACRKKLK